MGNISQRKVVFFTVNIFAVYKAVKMQLSLIIVPFFHYWCTLLKGHISPIAQLKNLWHVVKVQVF